jgi:hypothetical protein
VVNGAGAPALSKDRAHYGWTGLRFQVKSIPGNPAARAAWGGATARG